MDGSQHIIIRTEEGTYNINRHEQKLEQYSTKTFLHIRKHKQPKDKKVRLPINPDMKKFNTESTGKVSLKKETNE